LRQVLQDRHATPDMLEAATSGLAFPGQIGGRTTIISGGGAFSLHSSANWSGERGRAEKLKREALELRDPTVAEAILAVAEEGATAEPFYSASIVELGDTRIVPALLARFAKTTNASSQWLWAFAADQLGESAPLERLSDGFKAGQVETEHLSTMVGCLARSKSARARAALAALSNSGHPGYAKAKQSLLAEDNWSSDEEAWDEHPYCLDILMNALTDDTPTGLTWQVRGDSLVGVRDGRDSIHTGLPECVKNQAARRNEAVERCCDLAAKKLTQVIFGAPDYSPLLKDADSALRTLKERMDRWRPHLRLISKAERQALNFSLFHNARFVLDIHLAQPATAGDVAMGRRSFTSMAVCGLPTSKCRQPRC
jgi:hypothetical protein